MHEKCCITFMCYIDIPYQDFSESNGYLLFNVSSKRHSAYTCTYISHNKNLINFIFSIREISFAWIIFIESFTLLQCVSLIIHVSDHTHFGFAFIVHICCSCLWHLLWRSTLQNRLDIIKIMKANCSCWIKKSDPCH